MTTGTTTRIRHRTDEAARHLVRGVFSLLLTLGDRLIPKGETTVIRTFPSVEDTGTAIWEVLDAPGRARLVWLVDDLDALPSTAPRGPRYVRGTSLRGLACYLRARTVLHTHGVYAATRPSRRKLMVNLWHGMPIKRLERAGVGDWQTDVTIATSDVHARNIAQMWALDPARVAITGLPRNDIMIRAARAERAAQLTSLCGQRPIVLWMPTYRNSYLGQIRSDGKELGNPFQFDIDPERLDDIATRLGVHIIVKAHPMARVPETRELRNLSIWSNADLDSLGMSPYQLVGQSQVLITDYSSIWVDFLLLDRPIVFAVSDLAEYAASRGLCFTPLRDYLPGPIATDANEFEQALTLTVSSPDAHRDERTEAIRLHHRHLDDSSADRVLSHIAQVSAGRLDAAQGNAH